ncbi:NAD(P)-dependent oxidoreductase [Nocardiopsis composta]|uniref:Putative NADH-flavin reductase n=1 Tax=Nocardiopsis composta TaxID=157465 RepID=A0A7W8QPV4_9ACTN|nr:NAD(P)H-binding protein [Nocardiopsis composta]MBB5434390.1 putative NADH-flavin reductase [Nocardiopsis composta]
MRITVLGAGGGIGREVVAQALAGGHRVTAVVRDRARAGLGGHDRLDAVTADALDPASLLPAVKGADAVVSALGGRGGLSEPTTVCERGALAAVEAMHTAEVRRIVAISAATVTDEGDGPFTRLAVKPLLRRMLRHPRADSIRMEEVLAGSGLDWTVLRPPRLLDRPRTGRYRMREGANVRGGLQIGRADVADAVLRVLADPARIRTAVGVAY